jgi:ketosteroid isomerase-like protein
MKYSATFLFTLILHVSAQEPTVNHETGLFTYIEALNTHSWERIAPHIAKDAVFIFTEGTFVGHSAAKAAFKKTFELIEDEIFSLRDIKWTAVTDDMASCHYEFRWKGLINGAEASGGGRGTSILGKLGGHWLIVHEHLGPYPRGS